MYLIPYRGFSGSSVVKNPLANGGNEGLIPCLGRSPGDRNGYLLQYSCLENPMDGGAWWATAHRATNSQTWLSNSTTTIIYTLVCVCLHAGSVVNHAWLCYTVDYSPPGSSVHGIFQARILEWVAISFSRRSSQPRDWTWVSWIVGRCFTIWATREVLSEKSGYQCCGPACSCRVCPLQNSRVCQTHGGNVYSVSWNAVCSAFQTISDCPEEWSCIGLFKDKRR